MNFVKKLLGSSEKNELSDRIYGATHVGKVRKNNEDCFLIDSDKQLFIAADGMGGARAGEVASLNAVKAVNHYLANELLEMIEGDNEEIKRELINGVLYAHRRIVGFAKKNAKFRGMGCTIVVALVEELDLHICHVGDARAYVVSNSRMKLLTTDHSWVMTLVKKGQMTLEEARNSPKKNKITQAIGIQRITPEYTHYKISPGDRLLLCSDGLWDMLPDVKIHKILKKKRSARATCETLIDKANRAGGKDNVTAVVVYF